MDENTHKIDFATARENADTIGHKVKTSVVGSVIRAVTGLALITSGVLFVWLLMGGAIGGMVAGMLGGVGVWLVYSAFMIRTLPHDLVKMDDEFIYVGKTFIEITDVQKIVFNKNSIRISPFEGREIRQSFIANPAECTKIVRAKLKSLPQVRSDV